MRKRLQKPHGHLTAKQTKSGEQIATRASETDNRASGGWASLAQPCSSVLLSAYFTAHQNFERYSVD